MNKIIQIFYLIIFLGSVLGIIISILYLTQKSNKTSNPKRVSYIGNWTAFPSGTFSNNNSSFETNSPMYTILKATTHLVVGFAAPTDFLWADNIIPNNMIYRCTQKCNIQGPASISPPGKFKSNSEFITAVKKVNRDIKIMISFGGAGMGCCAEHDHMVQPTCPINQPTPPTTKWYPQAGVTAWDVCLGKSVDMKKLATSLVNIVKYPDGKSNTTASYDGIDFDYEWLSSSLNRNVKGHNGKITDDTILIQNLEILTTSVRNNLDNGAIISHAPRQNYFLATTDNYAASLAKLLKNGTIDYIFVQMYNGNPTAGSCNDKISDMGFTSTMNGSTIHELCNINTSCCTGGATAGTGNQSIKCIGDGLDKSKSNYNYRNTTGAINLYTQIVKFIGNDPNKVVWGCLINDGVVKNFTSFPIVQTIYNYNKSIYKNWGYWQILGTYTNSCVQPADNKKPIQYVENWISSIQNMITPQPSKNETLCILGIVLGTIGISIIIYVIYRSQIN